MEEKTKEKCAAQEDVTVSTMMMKIFETIQHALGVQSKQEQTRQRRGRGRGRGERESEREREEEEEGTDLRRSSMSSLAARCSAKPESTRIFSKISANGVEGSIWKPLDCGPTGMKSERSVLV